MTSGISGNSNVPFTAPALLAHDSRQYGDSLNMSSLEPLDVIAKLLSESSVSKRSKRFIEVEDSFLGRSKISEEEFSALLSLLFARELNMQPGLGYVWSFLQTEFEILDEWQKQALFAKILASKGVLKAAHLTVRISVHDLVRRRFGVSLDI
jgi:hypothetical protein